MAKSDMRLDRQDGKWEMGNGKAMRLDGNSVSGENPWEIRRWVCCRVEADTHSLPVELVLSVYSTGHSTRKSKSQRKGIVQFCHGQLMQEGKTREQSAFCQILAMGL